VSDEEVLREAQASGETRELFQGQISFLLRTSTQSMYLCPFYFPGIKLGQAES